MSRRDEAYPPEAQQYLLGQGLEKSDLAVFLGDESLRYFAVSQGACRLLGFEREELLEMDASQLVDLPVRRLQNAYRDFEQAGIREGPVRLRRRDGTTVQARHVTVATRAAGMPAFLTICVPVEEA
jgi:PAS domain S-box-containing protein